MLSWETPKVSGSLARNFFLFFGWGRVASDVVHTCRRSGRLLSVGLTHTLPVSRLSLSSASGSRGNMVVPPWSTEGRLYVHILVICHDLDGRLGWKKFLGKSTGERGFGIGVGV